MRNQQDKPASFISKLYNILRSKQNAKIIYWDSQHRGIRILNQKKLQQIILPKYFRHNRFSSFVRQLNMYDFHKVHMGDHKSIFLHNTFDPKKKDNIHLIRRKVTFDCKPESQKDYEPVVVQPQQSFKQNVQFCSNFMKSSRKMLYKNSFNLLSQKLTNINDMTEEQALDEILLQTIPLKGNREAVDSKITELKRDKKYRKFLKQDKFRTLLLTRLDIQPQDSKKSLSQLSIEDQLVYRTRKCLGPKSLKLLESGPLNYKRDTIGNFLNF